MNDMAASESRIESYLVRVRTALRGVPEREVEDILREIRSHAIDLAETGSVDEALRSFGDPVDLARKYRADADVVKAECSGSPLVILQGLRHASRSWIGRVAITALYLFGWANVLMLWAAAGEKLFTPADVGWWYTPGAAWPLTLVTNGRSPAGSTELLGWWLVPAAVLAGWIVRYVVDRAALWWLRRYRQSKAHQTA